jgi:hypothetical protein
LLRYIDTPTWICAPGDRAINGTVVLATTPQALTWAHFAEAATHPPLQVRCPQKPMVKGTMWTRHRVMLCASALAQHGTRSRCGSCAGGAVWPVFWGTPLTNLLHHTAAALKAACGLKRQHTAHYLQRCACVLSATQQQVLLWLLQAQEFVVPGAKVVTGYPGQGAASEDDWQPTLWRGLGFDFSDVLHASDVSTNMLH